MKQVELVRPEEGVSVVVLQGEHDLATKDHVWAVLADEIERNRAVVVDVSQAEFVDSSVMDNLACAHRDAAARGSRLVLQVGGAPIVRRALELSGLMHALDVAHDRAGAINAAVSSAASHHPRGSR